MSYKITMKAARVNVGLTQRQASKKFGVSKDTVGNWERGKSYPNIKIIPTIEKVYNIKYEDIIFLPNNNTLSVK